MQDEHPSFGHQWNLLGYLYMDLNRLFSWPLDADDITVLHEMQLINEL